MSLFGKLNPFKKNSDTSKVAEKTEVPPCDKDAIKVNDIATDPSELGIREFAFSHATLPVLPHTLKRVVTTIGSEHTFMDLVLIASEDPMFAAALLRIANDSIFASGGQVHTIEEAILRIGLKDIPERLKSSNYIHVFQPENDAQRRLWRTSVMTAKIAKHIGKHSSFIARNSNELYLCGLLCNLGSYITLSTDKNAWNTVASRLPGLSRFEAQALQHELIGYDNSEVGAMAAKSLSLPKSVELVCSHFDSDSIESPKGLAEGDDLLLRAVKVANHLANFILESEDALENNPESLVLLIKHDLGRNTWSDLGVAEDGMAEWLGVKVLTAKEAMKEAGL